MSEQEIIEPGTEVSAAKSTPPVASKPPSNPMELMADAVARGADIEVIEKLMGLHERWEKNEARKAFDKAIATAKKNIPVIIKNRHVGFDSKKPGAARTNYKHEDMAQIAEVVNPILANNGLSYRYRTRTENNIIWVTCIVSHRDGHSEETELPGPADTSGNKNNLQAIGSTVTYLQRYTLKSALGLAAADDDDGADVRFEQESERDFLSEQQQEDLVALCEEAGLDREKLLKFLGVPSFAEIYADRFDDVVAIIEKKKERQGT